MKTENEIKEAFAEAKIEGLNKGASEFMVLSFELVIELILDVRLLTQLLVSGLIRRGGEQK